MSGERASELRLALVLPWPECGTGWWAVAGEAHLVGRLAAEDVAEDRVRLLAAPDNHKRLHEGEAEGEREGVCVISGLRETVMTTRGAIEPPRSVVAQQQQ